MKIDKLDKAFSEYIRKRDCLPGTEVIKCCSCSSMVYWKIADAGHYIDRQHMSLRFDERNVNAQCCICNRHKDGNLKGYERFLKRKYGTVIIEELNQLKHLTKKYSQFEIDELTKFYKQKTKEL